MSELRLEGPCHECGGVGPVVIVQCDTDPGDMGEPRIAYSIGADQETVVFVPSFSLWPRDREARICRRYFTGTDVLCKIHDRDLGACVVDPEGINHKYDALRLAVAAVLETYEEWDGSVRGQFIEALRVEMSR